ncbi:MAG: type III-B CRISPR module RAMP protein Cmr6 [Chloroflexi bacterium]|nr:type III-B CRISPR module RAMP protein Cmr6 [Chloroflexota bacterium]
MNRQGRRLNSAPVILPLPSDTKRMARAREGANDCANPGLWLDKFAAYTMRGPKWEMDLSAKKRADVNWQSPNYRAALEQFNLRWAKILEEHDALEFTAEPEWRMAVGLGGASVRETGLALHRLYGFPIIPGSALKGLTSSWAEINDKDATERARVFGKQDESGAVIFFDAIPLAPPQIKLDVMNPHYGEYYLDKTGRTPPADWHRPVPVYFLTLEKNSRFLFAVAPRRREHPDDQACAGLARDWLGRALRELGVGAKTSAGYGFVNEVQA